MFFSERNGTRCCAHALFLKYYRRLSAAVSTRLRLHSLTTDHIFFFTNSFSLMWLAANEQTDASWTSWNYIFYEFSLWSCVQPHCVVPRHLNCGKRQHSLQNFRTRPRAYNYSSNRSRSTVVFNLKFPDYYSDDRRRDLRPPLNSIEPTILSRNENVNIFFLRGEGRGNKSWVTMERG